MFHRLFVTALAAATLATVAAPARAQTDDADVDATSADAGDADATDAKTLAAPSTTGRCGHERIVFGTTTLTPPSGLRLRTYLDTSCWPAYTIDNQSTTPTGAKHRGTTAIKMIVLHETTGDRGMHNNSGHLVHFLVDHDGTVYQTMDLAKWGEHADDSWVNQRSIGIEIANDFRQTTCPAGRECVPVTTKASYQWVLTRQVQMEATRQLVDFLLTQVTTVPRTWIPMAHVTSTGQYFLWGTTGGQPMMEPLKDATCPKAKTPFERAACAGGVLQHSAIFNRDIDGAAPVLYTWLREREGPAAARASLKCILSLANKPAGKADPLLASDSELPALVGAHPAFVRFVQLTPAPVCIGADEATDDAPSGAAAQPAPSATDGAATDSATTDDGAATKPEASTTKDDDAAGQAGDRDDGAASDAAD